MEPCKVLYIFGENIQEVENFMYEIEGVHSDTRKDNRWKLIDHDFIYKVDRSEENMDDIVEELNDLPYDLIDEEVHSITICAPSKKQGCVSYVEKFIIELSSYLQSKGVTVSY